MDKRQGSALLTALFIVTLVAILATGISVRIRNDMYRLQMITTTDRLSLASQAVTIWAMERLVDPKENLGKASSNGKILAYPASLAHLYPNVQLSGELFDLQARFNINNMLDERYQFVFYSLLHTLNIGDNPMERKAVMDAVVNWIQPIKIGATHDEWQDKYARQRPEYLPSHQPMAHISELRLVYGITAQQYQHLIPFLTTLPEITPINLNTAPKKVLFSLSPGIKDSEISNLLEKRQNRPLRDLREATAFLSKNHIQPEVLTLESHYFLAVVTASIEDISMQTYVVLKRKKNRHGLWHVSLLAQSINTL